MVRLEILHLLHLDEIAGNASLAVLGTTCIEVRVRNVDGVTRTEVKDCLLVVTNRGCTRFSSESHKPAVDD